VNKFELKLIALAVGVAFSASSMAAGMSVADYSSAKEKIVADFNTAKAACASVSDNRNDICMAEATGRQRVATAKLEASYKPSSEAAFQARIAQAEADFAVAKERCDDSTGTAKSACLQSAEAAETAAKAAADTEMKAAQAQAAAPAPAAARVGSLQAADTLFDFDSAALRPAGRAALDDFIAKTKGDASEQISVVGYTDRLGSEAYNQLLSEQRVKTVEAYLVSAGVDADRIRSEGKGQAQPVTKAGDCEGERSADVIACLQPDRRVVVGVSPTVVTR